MRFVQHFRESMSPPVFLGAAGVILAFVIFGALFSAQAETAFDVIQAFIVETFGWFYVLTATSLLIFAVWIAISRFGDVKLGGDQSQPEFHYITWFVMMMSAGMGIGLVFFGVAEPVQHYINPLYEQPRSDGAIWEAKQLTFFHWGLHPWAIYIAIALPLAYFHFRHKLPLAPRSLLYPLIGDRIYGPIGHMVDIVATVGTLFGIGTSLGLGAMQINAGLRHMFDVPMNLVVQLIIITVITIIATISVVTGLKVGIRRLSQFNLALGACIMLFVLVTGPTIYILETFSTGIGHYMQDFPLTAFWVDPTRHAAWRADWTLFYWSWWIAWSPFVGVFAARISRGRTIRQFVLTMLLAPTLVGFLWFSTVGGTALFVEHLGEGGIVSTMQAAPDAEEGSAIAFYAMLEHLPLTGLLAALATVLIVVFFVTSSDSGSLVNVMVTSGGKERTSVIYRVFWCVIEGVVAGILLIAGGLTALRTASLTPGLPMAVLLLVACWGLVRALRVDMRSEGVPAQEQLKR